jgi:hypothetical protein
VFKQVSDGSGYVLEGPIAGHPARIEWGPSQRNYVVGRELRLRCELGLPEGFHLMLMNRSLAERLEDDAYARLTDGKQTVVQLDLPEESRWLTLYDTTELASLPMLSSRIIGAASTNGLARRWVEGELGLRLLRACTNWLDAERPLVIMTARGRLYLRTQLSADDDHLGPPLFDNVLGLAEAACLRARLLALPRGG